MFTNVFFKQYIYFTLAFCNVPILYSIQVDAPVN